MTNLSPIPLLFDTNILVYAAVPGGRKSLQAARIVSEAIDAGVAVVSSQNMLEFFRSTTRRRPGGQLLQPDRALLHIEHWMASCEFIQITASIVREAAHGAISYQMRVYDAALWATAKSNGIPVIVTEDMQSKPRIESVRYVNPFADDFAMSDVGL